MNRNVEEEACLGDREESISIEVTTHCNSACLHCFARTGISEYSNLSLGTVKEILSEAYNTGYRHLHITGGEPLLWEGLFEALDNAFGMGYERVLMNTNGTLLTEDVARRLAAYDGLAISVSLEGTEELHAQLRGQGSYRHALNGIEKIHDAGMDLIIFTIARKALLPELPHFADDLYNKFPDIKYLALIQLINVENDRFSLAEEMIDPESLVQLARSISLLNLYGLRTIVKNNPLVNVISKLIEMPWTPQGHPLYRERSMIVMANRDICLTHSSRDSFGKYKPGMIEKVLASNEYQRAVAPDATTCPLCKHAELCSEFGMVRPSEWNMNMGTEDLYCKSVLERFAS